MSLAVIQYLDRVCISQAAPAIQRDLHLSKVQMSWALSAFVFGLRALRDSRRLAGRSHRAAARADAHRRCGGRSSRRRSVRRGTPRRSSSRETLFGAGEAGCFPNLTRIFTTWLPKSERDRAQGLLWLAARWSGAFTPLAGRLPARSDVVAPRLRAVRRGRRHLGDRVLHVVPGRSAHAPVGERGGAGADADARGDGASAARCRGGRSSAAARWCCSACSTPVCRTGGIST